MTDLVSSRSEDLKQRQFEHRAWPPKSDMSDDEPSRELTDESEKPDSEVAAVEFVVGWELEQAQ